MRAWADRKRSAGARIGLVPTMGALHEGHLTLVRRAAELADHVVVSIFVNPMQFDRQDDFESYPRDIESDAGPLAEAGVAVLFIPEPAAMYPRGFQSRVVVDGMTATLCGARRPGHFAGVTTVVTKLFHAVEPHVAVFGEKDYQQLATIKRMVEDLNFGIDVVGVPTVREADGVALSSRNRLLQPRERAAARCIPRALRAARDAAAAGDRTRRGLLAAVEREITAEPLARLEYAELCDPDTLEALPELERAGRLAVAVWVGQVRLIDNCPIAAEPAAALQPHGPHAETDGAGEPGHASERATDARRATAVSAQTKGVAT
jgi:pantoate--beta-alanine ligase